MTDGFETYRQEQAVVVGVTKKNQRRRQLDTAAAPRLEQQDGAHQTDSEPDAAQLWTDVLLPA